MTGIVVVCHGRDVDDAGRPKGPRCRNRFRPPKLTAGRWLIADPSSRAFRPPTVEEVAEMARAKGWAVTPLGRRCDCPDHEPGDLPGMCPRCRRPAPEVTALVREMERRG